jgi:glycosyltransferase involved in cell wall biosynthesis
MSDLHTEATNAPSTPLKVLLMSVWHPELYRGGAQQIAYETFKALQKMPGVEPTFMAAVDRSMASLYKSGARITGFDGRKNEFLFLSQDYDYFWHKVPDPLLIESYAQFLLEMRPDVVHFHHFFLFGIELLTLTRKLLPNVRIVFTFHEYLSICAAEGQMLRKTDQSLCTKASSVRCHQCLPALGPELYFVRELWMKQHLAAVDVFTGPAKFLIERYVDWGLPREKFVYVTNGQPDYGSAYVARQDDTRKRKNRFGFFGQLVDPKGLWVILEAITKLRSDGFTDFTVEINGDNIKWASEARRKQFHEFLEAEGLLPANERILSFNGSYSVDQLPSRMNRVDWCIVPSVWWENSPLVIAEAFMFKRPVIASNIGGQAEKVAHDVNGLLFQVSDPRSLAMTMRKAAEDPALWDRLHNAIVAPPTESEMADQYLATYIGR